METHIAAKMVIILDVDSGRVDSVKDENGVNISPVGSLSDLIALPPGGPRDVAKIHWHHHSPGCITLTIAGGGVYQICFP